MHLRRLFVFLCALTLLSCAACTGIPDFDSSTTTEKAVNNDGGGFAMPSTEIQGVEVLHITTLRPEREINLSTACFAVRLTKAELREVRLLSNGEIEKIIVLFFSVSNRNDKPMERAMAVDFRLREGGQILTQAREHIQFGMEPPQDNWDVIPAGGTLDLVYAQTQIEPAILFERIELSVIVYDNIRHNQSDGNQREENVLLVAD